MNRFAGCLICLIIFVPSWCGNAQGSFKLDFSGLLSLKHQSLHTIDGWQSSTIVRYLPEVTVQQLFGELLWDINLSVVADAGFESGSQTDTETSASIYRLNTRLTTPQSDIRLGLQKINFGPAQLLRFLKWFARLLQNGYDYKNKYIL